MPLKTISSESINRIACLIIGPAGIGKTSQIKTLVRNGEKVCVLSAEAGLLCVQEEIKEGLVEGFEITCFSDMREAYEMLANNDDAKKRYQWVFIDSLTEISSRCVEAMKSKHTAEKDTFKLWGEYNDLMTGIIKAFRDLTAYSVCFTCLDSTEKDENNVRYVGPNVSGSGLKEKLTSYFDEVIYYTMFKNGEEKRMFVTQPYQRFPAKDRSGKLEPFEEPNLFNIKTKILN